MLIAAYQEQTRQFDLYPPAVRMRCLQLGLVSEIGELSGGLDKHVRKCSGAHPSEAFRCVACASYVRLELGDILWFAARLAAVLGISLGDREPHPEVAHVDSTGVTLVLVQSAAELFAHPAPHGLYSQERARKLLELIVDCVGALAKLSGSSLSEVASANIAKLEARRAAKEAR